MRPNPTAAFARLAAPVFVFLPLVACQAVPSIQIVDSFDGNGIVQIVTDEPGALAAEIALWSSGGYAITGATVNTALFDDPNPGDSPFLPGSPIGGDAEGLVVELELSRLFASFGAGDLGVGVHDFLTFEYDRGFPFGCGEHLIDITGIVAQAGVSYAISDGFGVIADCFSDFDGNGAVGDGDLTLLLSNWAEPVPPVPAGWNGAQPTAPAIGDDELTGLLGEWGAGTASSVPEPGSAVLLGIACLFARRARR